MSVLINFKICDNSPDCNGIRDCPTKAFYWDKENKPEDFIRYTLAKAYNLMDEVYDVAVANDLNLSDYVPVTMKEAIASKEDNEDKESNG